MNKCLFHGTELWTVQHINRMKGMHCLEYLNIVLDRETSDLLNMNSFKLLIKTEPKRLLLPNALTMFFKAQTAFPPCYNSEGLPAANRRPSGCDVPPLLRRSPGGTKGGAANGPAFECVHQKMPWSAWCNMNDARRESPLWAAARPCCLTQTVVKAHLTPFCKSIPVAHVVSQKVALLPTWTGPPV